MKIIFYNTSHFMHPVMSGDRGTNGCISSLSFMGEPIIMRNIRLLSHIVNIENVEVPKTMPYLKTLVRSWHLKLKLILMMKMNYLRLACFRVQKQD